METGELLEAIRSGYLFDIERRHRRGLCESKIKDDLQQAFLARGAFLSESAFVELITKGKEWRIVDGENRYIVAQVQGFIRVSRDAGPMTRKELAGHLGVTPGAITRLMSGDLKLSKNMADALIKNIFASDWLAEQVMFCAARDALEAIESRRDRALAVLIRIKFAGYPNVLKWLAKKTDWEE
jgi:transcriptional regulator with XRE-family HTH domain